jgi:hypothetical protein
MFHHTFKMLLIHKFHFWNFMHYRCITFSFFFFVSCNLSMIPCKVMNTALRYSITKLWWFIVTFMCFRYENSSPSSFDYHSHEQGIQSGNAGIIGSVLHLMKLLFNLSMIKYPSLLSSSITKWSIILFSELHLITFCFMKLIFVAQGQGDTYPRCANCNPYSSKLPF